MRQIWNAWLSKEFRHVIANRETSTCCGLARGIVRPHHLGNSLKLSLCFGSISRSENFFHIWTVDLITWHLPTETISPLSPAAAPEGRMPWDRSSNNQKTRTWPCQTPRMCGKGLRTRPGSSSWLQLLSIFAIMKNNLKRNLTLWLRSKD